ncbi:MAG TPA: M48 family metallopeptidase [Pirellulales bacterium]
MLTQTDFQGGVFHPDIEGGRAGARIELGASELVARTIEGQVFRLPYSQTSLEEGGASGRMIFCRNPDRSLTIFCEERQFLPALTEFTSGLLSEQIEAIRKTRSSGRWGCLFSTIAALCLLTGALVGGYYLFFAMVAAAVDALPTSVDERIGDAALPAVDRFGARLDEPALSATPEEIIKRLAPHAPLQFPFTIEVVDSLEANAFALPGGRMFVCRGMLEQAQSADELAGVLAHEMAHVTQRHTLHRIGRSVGGVVGFELLIGDVAGIVAMGAELLNHASLHSHTRQAEMEADLVGADILYAAGVDPLAVIKLAERFHQQQAAAGHVPDWFDDHPDFPTRIAAIKARVATMPPKQFAPLDVDWAGMKKALAAFDAGKPAPAPKPAALEAPAQNEAPVKNEAPDDPVKNPDAPANRS